MLTIIALIFIGLFLWDWYVQWFSNSLGWMFMVPGAKAPRRGTTRSVGLDLFPFREYVIDSGKTVLIDTGVVLSPPDGCFTMLAARSSLHKRGLMLVNGVGIVDPDYCGRKDTIKLAVRNFSPYATIVDSTQALAQAIFIPFHPPTPETVYSIPEADSRGGFGSTDGQR